MQKDNSIIFYIWKEKNFQSRIFYPAKLLSAVWSASLNGFGTMLTKACPKHMPGGSKGEQKSRSFQETWEVTVMEYFGKLIVAFLKI